MSYKDKADKALRDGNTKQMVSLIKTKWDIDEIVIGKLVSIEVVKFEETGTEVNGYCFDTDEGLIQFVMGKAVDTQAAEKFVIGNLYICKYLGKKELDKGKTLNLFNVLDCGKG